MSPYAMWYSIMSPYANKKQTSFISIRISYRYDVGIQIMSPYTNKKQASFILIHIGYRCDVGIQIMSPLKEEQNSIGSIFKTCHPT